MAGWGGRRKGSGRPPGTPSLKTKILAKLGLKTAGTKTPLEVMIDLMNRLYRAAVKSDDEIDVGLAKQALDAAERAAPFMHSRFGVIAPDGAQQLNIIGGGLHVYMPDNGRRNVPLPDNDPTSLIQVYDVSKGEPEEAIPADVEPAKRKESL